MDVTLPKWGMTMQEATVEKWLVAEGDAVVEGQPLVTVGTDKVDADVESPITGTVTRIVAADGDVVPVGGTLAVVE